MKLYVISAKYGKKVDIIEVKVKECPKVYMVTQSARGVYFTRIDKSEIDVFNAKEERVLTFDLEKGKELFKNGVNEILEGEKVKYQQKLERLNKVIESI